MCRQERSNNNNQQRSVGFKNSALATCYPKSQHLFPVEKGQGTDVSCCSFQGSSASLQKGFVQNAVTTSAVIAAVLPHNKTNATGDGVSTSEIA